MNIYKLNGIDLKAEYGIIPIHSDNSNIALAGAWNLPSRLGKTYHDWGNDENGIEPYVNADEISFGGIDISFTGVLKQADKLTALQKCNELYAMLDSINGTALLETVYGNFTVKINGAVDGKFLGDGAVKIKIPMNIASLTLPTVLPTNGGATFDGYGIDEVMFDKLGLIITAVENQFERPKPKSGVISTTVEANEIIINAKIVQPDYASFLSVVDGLKALFSAPGLRTLKRKYDDERKVFATEGFQITDVIVNTGQVVATFVIKLVQASTFTPPLSLWIDTDMWIDTNIWID